MKIAKPRFQIAAVLVMALGIAMFSAPVRAEAATYCTHQSLYGSTYDSQVEVFMPSTSSGSKDCVLERGVNGNGVKALQSALKVCYGKNIAVDGAFGPATYTALIQVQQSRGIAADGVYGAQTRANIKFDTTSVNNIAAACAWASQAKATPLNTW